MVRIVSDRFRDEGAPPGAIGFIVEKWEEGVFEVEVSRPDGATIALFSARENELELVDPDSLGQTPELSAADQSALETLRQYGTNLREPHSIDHHLLFPTQAVAEKARSVLLKAKYNVRIHPTSQGDRWLVLASHTLILAPGAVAGTVSEMERLAASLGGKYDGWRVQVRRWPQE